MNISQREEAYPLAEERVNAAIHGLAALLGLAGTVFLIVQANAEGFFVFNYVHRGKQRTYTVEIASDAAFADILSSAHVDLGSNGWYEVTFSATECAGDPLWESTVTYGEADPKKGNGK